MKNKTAYQIGAVILALSFLHPFSGTIVRASHLETNVAAEAADSGIKQEDIADDVRQKTGRLESDEDGETEPEQPDQDKDGETEAGQPEPDKDGETEPGQPESDADGERETESEGDAETESGRPESDGAVAEEPERPKPDADRAEKGDEREQPAAESGSEMTAEQEIDMCSDKTSVILSFYGMKKDNEYYLLEERKADSDGRVAFPEAPDVAGFRFGGWETADFRRVKETDSFAESGSLYAVFTPQKGTVFAAAAKAGSMGISASNPQVGQENRYEYAGGRVNWTVPATGYYDLYCYGAQGGGGYAENGISSAAAGTGVYGDMTGSRVLLKKGMTLTICAGQMPGLSTIHLGEGDSGGQSWSGGPYEYVDGYETYRKEWSHAGERTNGECFRYRGYPDGGYGGKEAAFCDNTSDHSGGAAGGGGGGSSSVTCNGARIISAAGGNGGTASYKTHDFSGTANGGSGGGYTGLRSGAGIVWLTEKLHVQSSGVNGGNGYVRIRVADISPIVAIEPSTVEWTKEDVILTAKIESPGQGLPDACISWEQDENGDAVWTDNLTCTVSQNGTYTCRVRDTGGNIGAASVTVKNMDRLAPDGEIRLSTAEWTKEDIVLEVLGEDAAQTDRFGMSGLEDTAFLWGRQHTPGEIVWEQKESGDAAGDGGADSAGPEAWTAQTEHMAEANGLYLCRIRDRAGNVGEISCRVTGIDRTPPTVTCRKEQTWYEGNCEVRLEGTDLQPDGTPGCGLADRPYSTDGITYTDNPALTIVKEGPVTVWVKDRLGNARKVTFSFFYDRREPESGEKADDNREKDSDGGDGGSTIPPAPVPSDLPPLIPASASHTERISIPHPSALFRPGVRQEKTPVKTKTEKPEIPAPMEDTGIPRQETVKLPVTKEQKEEISRPVVMDEETPPVREWTWKKLAMYSAWLAVVLCGLLWLLFCLLFEHVTVYRRDENGTYREIGRCAIYRKKDYKQINLLRLMKQEEDRDYKVAFSRIFVLLHRKEKVLLRTAHGVELRNIEKEIEILSCNSENRVLR